MILRLILSFFNRNKKLYIIVDNTVSKGKVARVCANIGSYNPNMLFSSAIIVKGNGSLNPYLYHLETTKRDWITYPRFMGKIEHRFKIKGTHYDAGKTQCEAGTLLGIGVVVNKKDKLDLSLY